MHVLSIHNTPEHPRYTNRYTTGTQTGTQQVHKQLHKQVHKQVRTTSATEGDPLSKSGVCKSFLCKSDGIALRSLLQGGVLSISRSSLV